MKKLICILLALYSFSVQAQVVILSACTPIASPKINYLPLGRHLVFVCTNDTRTAVYQDGLSCLHSACNVDATAAAALRILQAGGTKAAIDAEWSAIRWDCSAPPGPQEVALCKERMDWIATWWSDAIKDFKPAIWKVKTNGTTLTRPSVVLATGLPGQRATVGVVCLPNKQQGLPSGSDIRAQWVGGPDGSVTICKKGE